MMVGLFFLFLVTQLFAFFGRRTYAITLGLITILLCIAMFIHHATSTLNINL